MVTAVSINQSIRGALKRFLRQVRWLARSATYNRGSAYAARYLQLPLVYALRTIENSGRAASGASRREAAKTKAIRMGWRFSSETRGKQHCEDTVRLMRAEEATKTKGERETRNALNFSHSRRVYTLEAKRWSEKGRNITRGRKEKWRERTARGWRAKRGRLASQFPAGCYIYEAHKVAGTAAYIAA